MHNMATTMLLPICTCIVFINIVIVRSSTHWVVTEDGKIQAQGDSIFNLRRPYDMVALLKQEERAALLETLKEELLTRKEEIDRNEDKDTGLEQRFYRTDPDCIAAGKPLPEFDLYISTVLPLENKGIRPEEHIDFKAPPTTVPKAPDCTKSMDLDFSMHAFEHLKGMKDRWNLSGTPELGLKNAITHRDNVDDYGHLVYEAMQKNKTSWVLYNMAAFYWRIKGDPYHVIECLRRALHYSPRLQKDVGLISLANVLHRSRYSNEAAVVVHAALDVSKELNVNHFTLGNIYAVLAEYNKSVICFENTLKIQPDFEAAAKRRYAVKCHAKLESALESQHRSLQRTLNELKDYQHKHDYWQQQQKKLMTEQASADLQLEQKHVYDSFQGHDSINRLGEFCQKEERDGKQVLQCSWGKKPPIMNDYDFISSWSSQKSSESLGQEAVDPSYIDYMKPTKPPLYSQRNSASRETASKLPFKSRDWPTKQECDSYVKKYPEWNEFPTTFLPAENKGFEVDVLLAEAQGLKKGHEHPLPWYPPVCVTLADIPEGPRSYDHLQAVKERTKVPLRLYDTNIKNILLNYVDGRDVCESEVGQRILTALKKKIGPSWLLYNLAGLYWRLIGNSYHGIECVRRALYFAPDQYKDVPLVNLANILYKWGRVDDAVAVMRDAIAINDLEPETHFFLGNLLTAKGNLTGAIKHYQETLSQNALHVEALSSLRIIKCNLKFHQSAQSVAPKDTTSKSSSGDCSKASAHLKQQLENRVVCKTENGRESCVVETRTSGCDNCKQTCSVTPIKVDTCGNGECLVTLQNEHKHNAKKSDNDKDSKSTDSGSEHCAGSQSVNIESPLSDTLGSTNPLLDPEFNARLDEISEYYRQKGVCTGEECHRLMIQSAAPHRPHTRLEVVNGVLHQKLIFVESPADIVVTAADCVVFNDGKKSPGCDRDEFKPFDLDVHAKVLCQPVTDQHRVHGNKENPASTTSASKDKSSNPKQDGSSNKPDRLVHVDNVNIPNTISHRFSDENIVKFNPDPARHIHNKIDIEWPTWDDCRENYRKVNFQTFLSTWVSTSAKSVDIAEHVDFNSDLKGGELPQPECDPRLGEKALALEMIPAVQKIEDFKNIQERGLQDTLQKLGGQKQPVRVVGARIAQALKKNSTSWVLANLAALYWRVQGDSIKAVHCIKMGYKHSPADKKDVALLNLANILHKSGKIDDALKVTNMALEAAPNMVALHFTIANLFAGKEEWGRAMQFYEATLALQSSFSTSRQRLKSIRCERVLSNPHIYKNAKRQKKSRK